MHGPQHDMPLVVIPCRNEAPRIGAVVSGVLASVPGCDIVVIDDNSSDLSGERAVEAGALLLRHEVHLGYGAALETGYFYAARHGYNMVLQMDGDGQHLAEELLSLMEPVRKGEADIAIGSRYSARGAPTDTSLARRTGHRLFSSILRLMTGRSLTDPTSGFQALGPRALTFLSSGIFPCDYPDADVIVMAHLAGLRITEVPIRMLAREDGKSMHGGIKPVYYAIKMMLSLLLVLLNYGKWRSWRAGTGQTADMEKQ